MKNIAQSFEHLHQVITTPDFLDMKSLGGEIPFFISSYEASQQVEVDKAIKGLKNQLRNQGISVLEINLYDLVMDILERELGHDELFAMEGQMDKEEFKEALQSVLDINQVLIPAIRQLIDRHKAKIYFLTGIGLVFPYIRSHNVLNNLQNVAKDAPTLAFFPGKYNGFSLELFGLLTDDNYYRAFKIDNYTLKA
ncbi:MAG: DUF1788 domain-containing protein [Bacteroidetes bacterium]|nr:DUF1788 domain-containing protein [Bacteroidota bacterium]